MNNSDRRILLDKTKQAQQQGFQGSYLDVLQNPQTLMQFEQEFQKQQMSTPRVEAGSNPNVEVAQTPQQRQQGLRGRSRSEMPQAMVFPNVSPNTPFNTMGMKAPIDIKKYDEQGHLVKSYENVPPGIKSLPTGPAKGTVVETPSRMKYGGIKNRKKYQAGNPPLSTFTYNTPNKNSRIKDRQVDLRVNPYTEKADNTSTQAPTFQSKEEVQAPQQRRFFNQTVQEADRVAAITGKDPNYLQARESVTTGRSPQFVVDVDDPKYKQRAEDYRDKYGIEIDDPTVLERLANPLAQAEYYNRYGRLPSRAQMDLDPTYGNPLDMPLAIYNPASYVQAAQDASDAAGKGNYVQAALSGLGAIPGGSGAKGISSAAKTAKRVKNLRAINEPPLVPYSEGLESTTKVYGEILPQLKLRGKVYDEQFSSEQLIHNLVDRDNLEFFGTYGGRPIVGVKMPNGETEYFYKSTGWGGKKAANSNTTAGMWQPFGGFLDRGGKKGSWFIKDKDYINYYDSKAYETISENLDPMLMTHLRASSVEELDRFLNFKGQTFGDLDSYVPGVSRPIPNYQSGGKAVNTKFKTYKPLPKY